MKAGWNLYKFSDVCELKKGRKPVLHALPETGLQPYLGAKYLRGSKPAEFASVNDKNSVPVSTNEIIVICDGSNSGETFIGFNGILSSTMAKIVHDRNIDNRFLLHYLSSLFEQFSSTKTGSAIPHLDLAALRQQTLPLPPLPEQQRIVALLDAAFAGIATAQAHAENNLHNARAIFESHLQSVFSQRGEGWQVKKISEISKHSLGKMLDKAKNKGTFQPYLRNLNVRWFVFDLSDVLQMPFQPEEATKYTAIKGDVLICEGGYPGRAAIWDGDEPIYFQKALHRVRFHESAHNKWFLYYLYAQDKSGALKQHFNGAGIQHFTGEALAKFELPFPPLPEILSAVAMFDDLSKQTKHLESLYQRKLVALAELKKSLLHQAFSGVL